MTESFYKDRRVLVAGSTGLVGMALTRRLAAAGARVRATVHTTPPSERYPGVEYVQADLLKKEDCRRVAEGMEFMFLAAASTFGAAVTAKTPLALVTPNIILNALMLESAYFSKMRKVLWLSSTTGYPDTGARPVREEEMFGEDPYDGYYAVGWMKRYTEILCRMYSAKMNPSMCVQVVRPTNIYGPFDKFDLEKSHVLAALIRKVVERHRPIEVWGDGEDIRDLIYIDDFAEACLSVLEKSGGYDPVNIGLGKGYAVKEMLRIVCEADGYKDPPIVFQPERPRMIPIRLVDITKAETLYQFKAKIDLPDGVRRTIEWYKKNAAVAKR